MSAEPSMLRVFHPFTHCAAAAVAALNERSCTSNWKARVPSFGTTSSHSSSSTLSLSTSTVRTDGEHVWSANDVSIHSSLLLGWVSCARVVVWHALLCRCGRLVLGLVVLPCLCVWLGGFFFFFFFFGPGNLSGGAANAPQRLRARSSSSASRRRAKQQSPSKTLSGRIGKGLFKKLVERVEDTLVTKARSVVRGLLVNCPASVCVVSLFMFCVFDRSVHCVVGWRVAWPLGQSGSDSDSDSSDSDSDSDSSSEGKGGEASDSNSDASDSSSSDSDSDSDAADGDAASVASSVASVISTHSAHPDEPIAPAQKFSGTVLARATSAMRVGGDTVMTTWLLKSSQETGKKQTNWKKRLLSLGGGLLEYRAKETVRMWCCVRELLFSVISACMVARRRLYRVHVGGPCLTAQPLRCLVFRIFIPRGRWMWRTL